MLRFRSYIAESLAVEQLKHLEHLEDHPINAGSEGFNHAVNNLNSLHNALQGKKSNATITTKYDGSPSIVFGHNPENGKFFVASKSAFNKNPKINYTPEDIQNNHGHAPGLVEKLNHALQHLPKVAPKTGVYQGDLMYSGHDVKEQGNDVTFKPNVIQYSTDKNSPEGQKVSNSKLGVVVHTKYEGKTLPTMKATFAPSLSPFTKHPDVNVINPEVHMKDINYTPEQQENFKSELKKAKELHAGHDYSHLDPVKDHFKTYINSTVRKGTEPTVEGLKNHVQDVYARDANKLKSDAGKAKITKERNAVSSHIEDNREAFQKTLQIHKSLQNAKNHLVNALSNPTPYKHTIEGVPTKPEGFVSVIKGMPTKFVDRAEFSRQNFLANRS